MKTVGLALMFLLLISCGVVVEDPFSPNRKVSFVADPELQAALRGPGFPPGNDTLPSQVTVHDYVIEMVVSSRDEFVQFVVWRDSVEVSAAVISEGNVGEDFYKEVRDYLDSTVTPMILLDVCEDYPDAPGCP